MTSKVQECLQIYKGQQLRYHNNIMEKLDPLRTTLAVALQLALAQLNVQLRVDETAALLDLPPDRRLGHYAFPCFRFAAQLRKAPAQIAVSLEQHFVPAELAWLHKTEVKGGFLNFFIDATHLAQLTLPKIMCGDYFDGLKVAAVQTIMVEFSQPNTHKIFHVGHTRNVCLGDALARMLRYLGHRVITANYIGDEGAHIAKCLWHLDRSGETAPAQHRSEWLGRHYVLATQQLRKDDAEQQQQLSHILQQMETRQGKFYQLWQETRQYCLADFDIIYQWLRTEFDVCYYESEVTPQAKAILQKFIDNGTFTLSEGAYGADLDELGFFMVLKSDGNTLYATKDLALAYRKFQQYPLDRSLYVVGAEQAHYFRQLFSALELMGFGGKDKNAHLSYGLVRLKEGKMSSRRGNIVPFSTLQEQLSRELSPYLDKYGDSWDAEFTAQTLHRLALGTIKYGMLQSDPQKEIIFDLSAWLRFDGNTGLYLMYACARINSIIAKATISASCEQLELLSEEAEQDLIYQLYRFNNAVQLAATALKPSVLTTYLYTLAKTFSKYYSEHSVLQASSPQLSAARLALVSCCARTLTRGLQLLGIEPPAKM